MVAVSALQALPRTARVVIIGGGFAGAATAYHLVRAGVREVVVLEREAFWGYHASGRNAALARQITEDEVTSQLTTAGAAFLRDPPPGFAEAPLLRPTGSILLVDDDAAAERLLASAGRLGVPAERIDAVRIAARWPRMPQLGSQGVYFATDGVIDVHALLHGFLAGARRGGARLALETEVLGLRASAAGVEVVTSRGTLTASVVVNAAGAWVAPVGALAGARATFHPIKRHLFVTEAVEVDRGAPLLWNIGAREVYARPEGAGLLLSGCDERVVQPHDAVPDADAVAALATRLAKAAPALLELGIARSWACLRTFAPDRRPVIGWDADVPWLFWVAGLGGHGATASSAVGESAAALLVARLGPS